MLPYLNELESEENNRSVDLLNIDEVQKSFTYGNSISKENSSNVLNEVEEKKVIGITNGGYSQFVNQFHSLGGNSNTNFGNLTSSTTCLSTTFNTKASTIGNNFKTNQTYSCSSL